MTSSDVDYKGTITILPLGTHAGIRHQLGMVEPYKGRHGIGWNFQVLAGRGLATGTPRTTRHEHIPRKVFPASHHDMTKWRLEDGAYEMTAEGLGESGLEASG